MPAKTAAKEPMPEPATPPAAPAPAAPVERDEEAAYLRSLVRKGPAPGPSFKHHARVLRAFERLLGKNADGAGDYQPGLWALPEPGILGRILQAGWLVRDGSTMLLGVAGTGKTTFIVGGTRLFCGAPPRLLPHADVAAMVALPPSKRYDALRRAGVAVVRSGKQEMALDAETFDTYLAQLAAKLGRPWVVPQDRSVAVNHARVRKAGKKPPKDDALYRPGAAADIVEAWRLHDAHEAQPSPSSESDVAWYQEVFASYFEYFQATFIGLAKCDPDKKPDEILYKTKILKVTYPDVRALPAADTLGVPQGQAEETVFIPDAHAIVTAPVKFVNETNRMNRAVGDAFLGLMAEKAVEYRGVTFNSPDAGAVWWFDMNPHLGWGVLDWAFLDRVDVSVIVPALPYAVKVAYAEVKSGSKRDQAVSDAPEFNLQELQEIWDDVERVDLGDYLPEDLVADLAEAMPTFAPLSPSEKVAGKESLSYDPIWWTRVGGAMLEHFIATPPGFDFTRFVPHPAKAGNNARGDPGDHFKKLYEQMLKAAGLDPRTVGREHLFAMLERPFGFRAQTSMVKYAKALAWLRGPQKGGHRITQEDLSRVIPFVLNHRLQLAFNEAKMDSYFSVYDWLTSEAGASKRPDGHMNVVAARLGKWVPAIGYYVMMQQVNRSILDGSITDADKAISAARKWLSGDGSTGNVSIIGLASERGGSDYVLRQIKADAEALFEQMKGAGEAAVVTNMPKLVADRQFSRTDVQAWEQALSSGQWEARGFIKNAKQKAALQADVKEALEYLDLSFDFYADASAVEIADDAGVRVLTEWDDFVAAVIASVPPKSQAPATADVAAAAAAWRKSKDPANAVPPVSVKLHGVGVMTLQVSHNPSPPEAETRRLEVRAEKAESMRRVRKRLNGAKKLKLSLAE